MARLRHRGTLRRIPRTYLGRRKRAAVVYGMAKRARRVGPFLARGVKYTRPIRYGMAGYAAAQWLSWYAKKTKFMRRIGTNIGTSIAKRVGELRVQD